MGRLHSCADSTRYTDQAVGERKAVTRRYHGKKACERILIVPIWPRGQPAGTQVAQMLCGCHGCVGRRRIASPCRKQFESS